MTSFPHLRLGRVSRADLERTSGRAALSRSQRRRLEMLQAGLTVPLPEGPPESQAFAPQIFDMLAR